MAHLQYVLLIDCLPVGWHLIDNSGTRSNSLTLNDELVGLNDVIVSSHAHHHNIVRVLHKLSYIVINTSDTRHQKTHQYSMNRRRRETYNSEGFIDDNIWNVIGRGRVGRSCLSVWFCYQIRRNSSMFTWIKYQSVIAFAVVKGVFYRAFLSRSHCNWHNTSIFLSSPWAWKIKSEETCEAYTVWSLSSSQLVSFRCPPDHSSMQHCTYWQDLYSVSIKHLVGESCCYHCEHKSNDWNGHWGKVLMIHNSHVILGTKQRHINSLLDDRMAVWAMTFTAIPGLLLAKWGQCPLSRGETEAGPNRIDEIHISQ